MNRDFFNNYKAVTPSDTINVYPDGSPNTLFDALYVGNDGTVPGNVVVVDQAGNTTTFTGVNAGTVLRVQGKRVNSTNTTATNIVALRQV